MTSVKFFRRCAGWVSTLRKCRRITIADQADNQRKDVGFTTVTRHEG